jgi:hypothetical protein
MPLRWGGIPAVRHTYVVSGSMERSGVESHGLPSTVVDPFRVEIPDHR